MDNLLLEQTLCQLYDETQKLKFQKSTYETDISDLMSRYSSLMSDIGLAIGSQEGLEHTADILPGYARRSLDSVRSKRRRKLCAIDHNMCMVSYVIPLLGKIDSEYTDVFLDAIVRKWNEQMPDSPIGRASYEDICGGFRKNLMCFITTAVCRSMGRGNDCYELDRFRFFRDDILAHMPGGPDDIRFYYDVAPTIVSRIDREYDSRDIYRDIWDLYLKRCLTYIEEKEYDMCRQTYKKMVLVLTEKYVYEYTGNRSYNEVQMGYA